jgi:hypothetical protein
MPRNHSPEPAGGLSLSLSLAPIALAGLMVALTGCTTHTFRSVDLTPPEPVSRHIPEAELLDVGIAIFDPNVPEHYDEKVDELINEEVRRAESYYMPYVLKSVLESSGNWGAVRMVPRQTHAVDLMISGEILTSHGERLALAVEVRDARGIVWFKKKYSALGSRYAYQTEMPQGADPFQQLYTQIANDLAAHFAAMPAAERLGIRRVAELAFARDMAPIAYEGYLAELPTGQVEVRRLPAENDPMMHRVRKIRDREFMFIDTLDGHYAEYRQQVAPIYQAWRKASYDDAMARVTMGEQKQIRSTAGIVSMIGGLLSGPFGLGAVAGGAELLQHEVRRTDEILGHAEALREVSDRMEEAVVPHTIRLENETHELSGTVDRQYTQLRRILRDLYAEEFGIPPATAEAVADEAAADEAGQ